MSIAGGSKMAHRRNYHNCHKCSVSLMTASYRLVSAGTSWLPYTAPRQDDSGGNAPKLILSRTLGGSPLILGTQSLICYQMIPKTPTKLFTVYENSVEGSANSRNILVCTVEHQRGFFWSPITHSLPWWMTEYPKKFQPRVTHLRPSYQ